MKILVTGATGFLGNYIIQDLLSAGAVVVATSRNEQKAKSFSWYDRVEFIPFNINSATASEINLFEYFGRPDKAIHLAWEHLPDYNNLIHFESNLFSHYYFLKNLIHSGLKDLAVTGTCLEYGMQDGCLKEDMMTDPQNPYAISKDTLRRLLTILSSDNHFRFKWIRLFYIYGKGQSEKSLFTQMEKVIENNETEFKMSKGEQTRDFLSVKEVSANIIRIVNSEKASGIINCCSGNPQTVKSVVENYFASKNKIVKLHLGYYPYPDYEPFSFWGDTHKLKSIVD
jgi:nucleoside-diphosphate-sugar epimerase